MEETLKRFLGYLSEGRRRGVGLKDCQHGSNRKMADGDLEEGKSEESSVANPKTCKDDFFIARVSI